MGASTSSENRTSLFKERSGVSLFLFTDGKDDKDILAKRVYRLKGAFDTNVIIVSCLTCSADSSTETLNVQLDKNGTYAETSVLSRRINEEKSKRRFVVAIVDHRGKGFDTELYGRQWLSTDGKLKLLLDSGCDCVILPKTPSSNLVQRVENFNNPKHQDLHLRTYNIPCESNVLYVVDRVMGLGSAEGLEGGRFPFYSVVKNSDDAAEIMKEFCYYVLSVSKKLKQDPNSSVTASDPLVNSTTESISSPTQTESEPLVTPPLLSSTPTQTPVQTVPPTQIEKSAMLFTPPSTAETSTSVPEVQSASSTTVTSNSPVTLTPTTSDVKTEQTDKDGTGSQTVLFTPPETTATPTTSDVTTDIDVQSVSGTPVSDVTTTGSAEKDTIPVTSDLPTMLTPTTTDLKTEQTDNDGTDSQIDLFTPETTATPTTSDVTTDIDIESVSRTPVSDVTAEPAGMLTPTTSDVMNEETDKDATRSQAVLFTPDTPTPTTTDKAVLFTPDTTTPTTTDKAVLFTPDTPTPTTTDMETEQTEVSTSSSVNTSDMIEEIHLG